MAYGWDGELIRLVPLEKERHLDNCIRWLNDPELTQWMLTGDYPITALAEEEWFDKFSRNTPSDVVFAIETPSGEHIGLAGIHAIDYRHGHATTGTLIGEARDRGQGFGSDAIRTRTRYAFEVLGLRLLLSEVMDGNAASLRALAKAGYRECGRIPAKFWKRGGYRDSIQMACLREWPAATEPQDAESRNGWVPEPADKPAAVPLDRAIPPAY